MITGLGLIMRFLFDKAVSAIAWAVENWRISLPVIGILLCVLAFNHYSNVVDERDYLAKMLDDYVTNAKEAGEKRKKENAEKERLHQEETEKSKSVHQEHINKIARAYYETIKQKDADISNGNALRASLRAKLEAFTATRLPESASGFVRITGVREDGNAANSEQTDAEYIHTLEYACAITTADYNTLYDRCKAVNTIYGAAQP